MSETVNEEMQKVVVHSVRSDNLEIYMEGKFVANNDSEEIPFKRPTKGWVLVAVHQERISEHDLYWYTVIWAESPR